MAEALLRAIAADDYAYRARIETVVGHTR